MRQPRWSAVLFLIGALGCPMLASAAPQGKVVIAQGVDPTTLDPQWHEETPAYNVLLNIYETLLDRDEQLRIVPLSTSVVDRTTEDVEKAAILAHAASCANGFVHRLRILAAKIRDTVISKFREIQGDALTHPRN